MKDIVKALQDRVDNIRNVCVLAHVDHGKTTLVDTLIASNGIISQRMAGKLRYLDSRQDEQQRGITMKCSAISLAFQTNNIPYLVNVVDSPGHVDFFGEVSTAIRLCDGCIVLVDVVEGVCSQTKAALQQAWIEKLKPLLVLNKMDRLFIEKKMTSLDIYMHLLQILEQINAFLAQLFTTDVLGKCTPNTIETKSQDQSDGNKPTYDWSSGLDDSDDSNLYFTPESGNVVFASAIDGWGFTIGDFSKFLSKKYGIKEEVLNKTLWGDFYLSSKEKKIMKGALSKARKPIFVTMVLDNILAIYEAIAIKRDKEMIQKIVSSLDIKFTTRDVNHSDPRSQLQTLFSQWFPISNAVLKMICQLVPSPKQITEERVENLMCSNTKRFDSLPQKTQNLKNDFIKCSSDRESALIICVSKMFSFEKKFLPQFKQKALTHEEINERRNKLKTKQLEESNVCNGDVIIKEESNGVNEEILANDNVLIAFARVFSGTIRTGDTVFVLGPKHNVNKIDDSIVIDDNLTIDNLTSDQHITKCCIDDLYILMGRELEAVDEVKAGNILGIGGLDNHIIKSGTLSTTMYCPPFIDLHLSTIPILRVALEPQNPTLMPKLIDALKKLNQADPCVDVKIQETGEHVIVTTGEVHLQRCITDLTQYSSIEINCSEPIVPFRETIVLPPKVDMTNELIATQRTNTDSTESKSIELFTVNKKSKVKIIAKPLPEEVCDILGKNSSLLKVITRNQRKSSDCSQITEQAMNAIEELRSRLKKAFIESDWPEDTIDHIWSFGPKYCGTNLLINRIPDFKRFNSCFAKYDTTSSFNDFTISDEIRQQCENSFISGFQLATLAGPLCDEPLMSVCFIAENWTVTADNMDWYNDPFGPFSGQIMSTVKECCKKSFQAQPQRLMAAMFSCTIQVDSDALGKMYAVLGRRHGRVLDGDIQEGSDIFNVTAVLPVIESFDFANEIRKQTSGKACPQLVFSHWEIIDIDPYWVPTTEEEYALFGEKSDTQNRGLKYMNGVRKRKGLHIHEKIVEFAEKQRTLTRNK
ncbi:elongation factor-like GTPase 1 [Oppia nitens]|uniref:elongation factor-like GTPase 1 n=1 Tax=Oppia nitens TaxID=1686743 RepID=UPI0023DC27DC|nr:elongation factor-like GTPase 1 [Oppia nitens]